MELRHLRYFVTVAEELHSGRAAQKLHISQRPLSMQIRALGNELRETLLKRTQRHVSPTQAGAALLGEARHILARVEQEAIQMQAIVSLVSVELGGAAARSRRFISSGGAATNCRPCGCSSMASRKRRRRRTSPEKEAQPHERYRHY